MDNNEVLIPTGNRGTNEKPYVLAYMCASTFVDEITGTTSRMFPSMEEHRAGCPCGKWGTVEVAVHFVRYIKSRETELKEQEREHERGNMEMVVRRIRTLQSWLPVPLNEIPGAKGSEMVDYWLERHEQNPNGQALFWALDALYKLGSINSCTKEFWEAMLRAGKELSDKWSKETKSAEA